LFGGRRIEYCGGNTATGVRLATTAMCMVAATRSSMLHNDASLNWAQLSFFLFRSSIVW